MQIHTDDPEKPLLEVIIYGTVEQFARIEPNYLYLSGPQGQPLSAEVVIIPGKEYPFSIKGIELLDGRFVKCELTERCTQGADRCVLRVENIHPEKGSYTELILVRTDSALQPEISIRVTGLID